MTLHFGLKKARAVLGGDEDAPALSRANTPRDFDFDPFEALPESRELSDSPFNEAALIFCILSASTICLGLVVLYAFLRAVGL